MGEHSWATPGDTRLGKVNSSKGGQPDRATWAVYSDSEPGEAWGLQHSGDPQRGQGLPQGSGPGPSGQLWC